MRALVEMLDQATFHHIADNQHDRYRKQNRQRYRPVNDRLTRRLAEPHFDVRHLDLKRIAKKVRFRRINDHDI